MIPCHLSDSIFMLPLVHLFLIDNLLDKGKEKLHLHKTVSKIYEEFQNRGFYHLIKGVCGDFVT